MASPSETLATLRPELGGSLEEFNLAMDRQGFIGHRVLPVFEAAKQSGPFGKIPLEQLLQTRDTARAPGSGYARGNFTFAKDSYATEEHGAEEVVDDREAAMYGEYIDAELYATARAFDAVLRNAEIRAAALLFNDSTWTGASLTTTVGTNWTTVATATPLTDVEAAVQKVYDNSGLWPNAIIMNRKVARNLRFVSQIIDRVKYQGFVNVQPAEINEAMLSQAFDLNVIVAGSSKNTANEGQAASLGQIWANNRVMVCRIAMTGDIKEPCVGRTFHWNEDGSQVNGTVETYREDKVRGEIVRVRHDVDEKILYTEAAHTLRGTFAS